MKLLYISILSLLVSINIYLFAKGIVISDAIQKLEVSTEKLRIENSDLQTKLYEMNSLSKIDTLATDLGFTKKAEPVFLNPPAYAAR